MTIKDIISYQKNNKRPSMHGKILNNYDGVNKSEYFVKGYMRKKHNIYRNNCYLTTPFVISQINYNAYSLFLKREKRENIYYSGYFDNCDFFYERSYKEFQQKLLSDYASFRNFIKMDIENFFGNISLTKLRSMNIEEINSILDLLERIGLKEYPIFEDCAGMSYIATEIYLEDLDKKLTDYFSSKYNDFRMIRYSDDLYVFFDGEFDKSKSICELRKIYNSVGLKMNEEKYVFDSTVNLPNHVNGKLYDLWVNEKDFELYEVLGDEDEIKKRVSEFIVGISKITNFNDYDRILNEKFEINYKDNFKKNIFDEIIYNQKIKKMIEDMDVSKLISKKDMSLKLEFDPVKLTVLFLKYRENGYPQHILHSIYNSIEKANVSESWLLTLLTYYNQRNVEIKTKEKIIEKLKINFSELAEYLSEYI